jgi:hypothetical protein
LDQEEDTEGSDTTDSEPNHIYEGGLLPDQVDNDNDDDDDEEDGSED